MAQKESSPMADALKLVGGGIVGAGLALLLAPQPGKKTRKDIVRYAKTVGGKTNEAVYEFAESIDDFVDTVGNKAAGILHNGKEMTHEAKKELLSAIEKGQEKLEKQKSRLVHLIG